MQKKIKCFIFLLALGQSAGFGLSMQNQNLEPAHKSLRLFYTANRQGEIDPCHCQGGQLGGLTRTANFLALNRKGHPFTFWGDSGDTFFLLPAMPASEMESAKRRAETVAKGMKLMHLDALTPGERDFAAGGEFLGRLESMSGAVFVSANIWDRATKKLLFEPYHVFKMGDFKIVVLGLTSPEAFQNVAGVQVNSPLEAAKETLQKIKSEGADTVILLSHLGLIEDRKIAAMGGIDFIFGAHSQDILSDPELVDHTRIVQPQNQGQQIGVIDLEKGANQLIHHEVVNLEEKFEGPNEITPLIRGYQQSLVAAAETTGRPSARFAAHPYVAHPQACRSCHKPQYDFWATTKHASAYLVLYSKTENFDPSCISCHSLGYGRPEGFTAITKPLLLKSALAESKPGLPPVETLMKTVFAGEKSDEPLDSNHFPKRYEKLHSIYLTTLDQWEQRPGIRKNFLGVQCENCHGNLDGHPGSRKARLRRVREETCRMCHRAPNAPDFNPAWKVRVACPLMKTNP